MTDSFLTALLIAAVTGAAIIAIVLIWLVRAYLSLRSDYQRLSDRINSSYNDLAGLCSAALAVDRRMDMNDEQLQRLWAKLSEIPDYGVNEQPDHPYRSAIQKVRSGASVTELMQSSGLSHDEAALLIRLHGSKAPP